MSNRATAMGKYLEVAAKKASDEGWLIDLPNFTWMNKKTGTKHRFVPPVDLMLNNPIICDILHFMLVELEKRLLWKLEVSWE